MNTKISIITVCYNAIDYLQITIESVLSQTYKEIEHIIIDGGSNDGSVDLLKKYSHLNKVVSEPDNGIYDAMNKGIKLVTGEWVLFLNAGDRLYNCDTIDSLAKVLFKSGIDTDNRIFLGDICTVIDGEPGKVVFANDSVSTWYSPPHQGMIFPISALRNNSYDISLNYLADRELYLRLVKENRYIPSVFGLIVAYYDMTGVSSKGSNAIKIYRESKIIGKKFGENGKYIALSKAITKYVLSLFIPDRIMTKLRFSKCG